jgi:hypothetical protein
MAEDLEYGTDTTSKTHASGGVLNGHQISLSSFATVGPAGSAATATWDPATVANGASVSTTVAVSGAALGDFALASFSLDLAGATLTAYVSAANVVTVLLANLSGAELNLSSGTLKVLVFQTR